MTEFVDPFVFWVLMAVQMVGLGSVLLGRLPESSQLHEYCRGVYMGCVIVLGLATMIAIGCNSGCWAWCGTTFSIMIVGGVFDVGGSLSANGF